MLKLNPNDAEGLSLDDAANGARLLLYSLAVKALIDQGKQAALDALASIASGRAHMTFAVEINAEETVIVGQLNDAGELLPLVVRHIKTPVLAP